MENENNLECFSNGSKYHEIILKLRKRLKHFGTGERNNYKNEDIFFYQIFLPLNIFFKNFGLEINRIELKEYNSALRQGGETNDLRKKIVIQKEFIVHNEAFVAQKAKDEISMSEKKYISFRNNMKKLRANLPSLYKMNSFKTKMNKFYTILQNSMGYYVEPIEKLTYVLTKIYSKLDGRIQNNTFELFLSGDGMQLTRTMTNSVNFTFKVLNEMDPNALYILGISFFENLLIKLFLI